MPSILSREAAVLEWQWSRRQLALSKGATEQEIQSQWIALHALGIYIDDGGAFSISDHTYL